MSSLSVAEKGSECSFNEGLKDRFSLSSSLVESVAAFGHDSVLELMRHRFMQCGKGASRGEWLVVALVAAVCFETH